MRKLLRPLVFALVLSTGLAAGEPAADNGLPLLLARSTHVIEDALKQEMPGRRAAVRARVTALLLAEAAQQNLDGNDAPQRVAVRDAAVQVAQLIAAQEYAKARQLAATLSKVAPKPSALKQKIKLMDAHLEVDELMSLFRKVNLGGLGIETELDRLENESANGTIATEDLTEALLTSAYQTALAAKLLQDHQPAQNAASWRQASAVMQRTAEDLAKAVKAKDGKAAFQAVVKANTNCTACHKAFR